jgi:hypothetical protein
MHDDVPRFSPRRFHVVVGVLRRVNKAIETTATPQVVNELLLLG